MSTSSSDESVVGCSEASSTLCDKLFSPWLDCPSAALRIPRARRACSWACSYSRRSRRLMNCGRGVSPDRCSSVTVVLLFRRDQGSSFGTCIVLLYLCLFHNGPCVKLITTRALHYA